MYIMPDGSVTDKEPKITIDREAGLTWKEISKKHFMSEYMAHKIFGQEKEMIEKAKKCTLNPAKRHWVEAGCDEKIPRVYSFDWLTHKAISMLEAGKWYVLHANDDPFDYDGYNQAIIELIDWLVINSKRVYPKPMKEAK